MSKKSLIIPLIVLLAAAGLLFGIAGHLTGWLGNRPDQVTDDAYLRVDKTPLSTRISGTVRKVNVNDYQSVKAGQILIELDDDYRAALNQAQAALAASEASLADSQAAKRIQDAQIDAAKVGIVQAEAAINAVKAGIASASPALDRALTELHRQQSLFDSKAATHQQLETATAQQGQLSGVVEARKADLARAEGALATSHTFPNRVFDGKVEQLSPASGSQFSLLPPDNATGNFTKVVQRVPVKIVFFRDSLISIGCGRDSPQSSPFIPVRLEGDRTVINDRS